MLNRFKRGVLACALTVTPTFATAGVSTVTPPNLAGGVAGTITGQAGVSSRGSSQYSFPIAVPPGTAGMLPSLGMSYDSDNRLDISGLGWSLSGLSTITRCKRTLATDQLVHPVDLTVADAYCLNGERLVKISGVDGTNAEYRTEVESYQRVKSFGSNAAIGPDHWTVETRDGRITTIGGAMNSTVLATKGTTTVNWVWTVQRVQDQHGNYMTFAYEASSNGEYFPTQILYTGNTAAGLVPYNSVDFIYETRNDVFSGRVSDALVKRPNRLKQIRTRIGVTGDGTGGSVARQWNFAYTYSPYSSRSLLQSVADCNGDGSQCLPATNFAWTQRDSTKNTSNAAGSGIWTHGPGIQIQATYQAGSGSYYSSGQFSARAVSGDFNGDGKQDLVTNFAGSTTWKECVSTGSDFNCSSLAAMPNISSENFFVGDFNGDGRSDILASAGGGQPWYICLSIGSGFSCTQTAGLPTSGSYVNLKFGRPLVGDFDGDGRDDILFRDSLCTSTGGGFTCRSYNSSVYGMWNTAPGFPQEFIAPASQMMGDFDGDGAVDILALQTATTMDDNCSQAPVLTCKLDTTYFYRYKFGPTGLVQTSTGYDVTGAYSGGPKDLVDLNGDGVFDLNFAGSVQNHNYNGTITVAYWVNTCIGGTDCTAHTIQHTDLEYGRIYYGDYFQTGAAVGIYGNSTGVFAIPFKADGSSSGTTFPWTYASDCTGAVGSLSLDVDGDGLADTLCYIPSAATSTTGTWKVWLTGSGSFPDRLQSVTDGNGLTTKWTYVSGNDATVVASGSLGAYPAKNVHVTTPVVSKMSVDADSSQTAGKTLDTTYFYSGMRMDLRGRGSLGFDTVKSTELSTGVVTTTQYSQSFPTIARANSISKVGGGVTLQSQVLTWATLSTQPGLTVLYPYVRTQVTTGQELDGTWLPKTTYQVGTQGGNDGIDGYGNLLGTTTISVENNGAGDAYQQTDQCTLFENRTDSQWILGLCHSAIQSVTPANPNAGARQTSSAFDAFGALQSSISMPGTPLALTTSYVFDLNLGLPTSVTHSWTDPIDGSIKSPTSTATYDSAWRFVVDIKNPLNQTQHVTYDVATGVQTSLTDFNGLTTLFKVDAWGRRTEEDRPDSTYRTFAHRLCVDTCGALAKVADVVQHWAPGGAQMLAPEETLYDSRGRKLIYRTWNDSNLEADSLWSYGDTGDLYSQSLPKYTNAASTGVTTFSLIDILHRPKQIDSTNGQGNGVDSTHYGYSALTTTITDANLHVRTQLLNALGQVKRMTDNNGQAITYSYDGFGDLLSTTDPSGNVMALGHDAMGHKISMADPDLGNWTYVVDAVGHTRRQTDAKNQTSTYDFDYLNRLIRRVHPDQESDWIYDSAPNGIGKIGEAYTNNVSGTRDYDRFHRYDALGREIQDTLSLDWDYSTLTTYNMYGLPATITHRRNAIGQVDTVAQVVHSMDYNVRGAVKSVQRDGLTVWTLMVDDASGRKRQETLGNGLVVAHGYNPYTGFLESINTGADDGTSGAIPTLQQDSYTYDAVGSLLTRKNRVSDGSGQLSESFSYDALDRLVTSTVSGLAQQSFNFDALGNITFKSGVGSYSYPTAGSARPHLVSQISGAVGGLTNPTFSYDSNGNLQNGLNRYFTWTASNLPLTVDRLTGSGVAAGNYPQGSNLRYTFAYGPDHDRTKQTVQAISNGLATSLTSQMYTAEGIEKEVDFVHNLTKIRTYLPEGVGFTEEDIAGTAISPTASAAKSELYFLKDNLGSPEVVVDKNSVTKQRMAYDAWGRRRNNSGEENAWSSIDQSGLGNREDHKGYTDQEELDELTLVHLNGRVYDPMTSRFINPDPTIPDPYDLQSFNRASYVRNSPMDRVDPSGFDDARCQLDSSCTVIRFSHDDRKPASKEGSNQKPPVTNAVPAPAPTPAPVVPKSSDVPTVAQSSAVAALGATATAPAPAGRQIVEISKWIARTLVVNSIDRLALNLTVGGALLTYSPSLNKGEREWLDNYYATHTKASSAPPPASASANPTGDAAAADAPEEAASEPTDEPKSDAERAKALGYDRIVKDPPFNPHGQKVFGNGKSFITPDVDGHNTTDGWKGFDRRGVRTGTYDADLNWIKK